MKGINPLLYGLNSFYGSSDTYQNTGQGSSSALSLMGSANTGTSISNQAKGISELYSMLKAGKNRNALAGLNQMVKTLIHDTDATALKDFVTLGLGSIVTGKKEAFTKLMGSVTTLDAKGGSALGTTIVKQAAKTFADKGSALTGTFIDTTADLAGRKFSDEAELMSVVGGFVTTWNALRTSTKKSSDIPDLKTFAQQAGSLDNTSLKTYLAKLNTAIKKAGASGS